MKRILIIDDDAVMRETIQDLLSAANYEINIAENGLKGLELQYKNPYDLIITDILMPEKDGIEVIVEIKKWFPDVKIIALSGGGQIPSFEYLKWAQAMEVDFVMKKPINTKELKEKVNNLLEEVVSY